jgi:long-chain acyl-CoA synthetase
VSTANNDYCAAQYPIDALATVGGLDTINTHDASTLDEAFRERVRRSSEKIAYTQFNQETDTWDSFSWAELAVQVERWQVAFRQSGLEKGDRVAICYRNSVEWVIFDQAALRLGLVVVPLYAADRADNIAYVIGNSGAKLALFADSNAWLSVSATDENVSCIERVIVFSGEAHGILTLVEDWLPERGQHFERGVASADDLASIVYTSGTTGRPKGVMLSHRNMLANAYSGMRSVALKPTDRLLSFLPLSHTLERTVGYYAPLLSGSSVAFNRSIKQLSDDLFEIKPTVMISVPRIFERVHNQIYTALAEQSGFQQWIFRTAINIGWRRFEHQQGLRAWHPKLLFAAIFDILVARKIKAKLGGALDFVIIGGAPLSQEVAKTFISLGIPLLQGYGLTESSPIVSVNTKQQNRLNSIGLLLRGVSVKIADNDELWVKGENVMMGYWNKPEATAKVIVEQGDERWLRTGDRASIDKYGFLTIIGRIKDILVLANGEKVPPPDIEAAIVRNPLFEQVMVVGEGKSFLAALVVLNKPLAKKAREQNGRDFDVYLVNTIAEQMDDFPGYAKIRKVHVCEQQWTVESGLMTPTLKLKRAKVAAYYADAIEQLYAGHRVIQS